jgi:hypothetical protein
MIKIIVLKMMRGRNLCPHPTPPDPTSFEFVLSSEEIEADDNSAAKKAPSPFPWPISKSDATL